jgi:hypothetical protein
MKTISRRALAQLALAGAASAQQPATDELEQARKRVQDNSEILQKQPVAMSTEPAFQFKA